MTKLIIDTSDNQKTTVSLKTQGKTIIEESKQTVGSQILLGLIDKVLRNGRVSKEELKEIEVNKGPGSFTGLKVGVSVANALGFSLGIPVNGKKIETELEY